MVSSISEEKTCYCPKSSDDSSDIHIPADLLHDILSRLPTKSLMRFRCVCKSWYSLITHDLEFHKRHLGNFNSNNNGPRWIGYQIGESCDYSTTKFWLYDESFDSDKIQAYHIHREETVPVEFYFSKIVGSCNGIVCLYLPVDEETLGILPEEWGFGKFLICLWNPSIRKYRRIEFPWKAANYYGFKDNSMMGFGLSIKSSVYKLVIICKDEHGEDHVYVYSLWTSSWTEIKAKPCAWKCHINSDPGTYFNGFCHWIRLHRKQGEWDYTMICFNLEDVNFSYIDLPPKSQYSPPYDCFKTMIFEDMLCVWESIGVGKKFAVYIWGMKEYGNRSSWSNFLRVHIKENYWFEHRYFRLFGIDAGGRLLFKTSEDYSPLRACDSHSGEIQKFQSCETVDIWDMAPYQESLLLL
ncbi:hypothetical protein RND81_07G178700 [Saponaria officinalis]|uniref:F-box domain-containing protein n=1 Tax=Saponaria officinalis TaxID=3572 RepID=A0AAW1JSA8_SAPOF